MKTVFVYIALFQLIWLSLSNGKTTTAPATGTTADPANSTSAADNSTAAADNSTAAPDSSTTAPDNSTSTQANSTATSGGNSTSGTQAPDSSTAAPAETEDVNCTSLSSDQGQCCAAGNMSACIFFNCTDADGNVSGTVCAPADAARVCAKAGDTASENMCDETSSTTPTSGENPTQSPSTGGSDGQKFDAASFIGGIVLCAGVLAISYFGLKFYRSRQEKNYRSM